MVTEIDGLFTGVIFITLTTIVVLLALAVIAYKIHSQRYRFVHIFRRRNASVHYSRVSIFSKIFVYALSCEINQNEFE